MRGCHGRSLSLVCLGLTLAVGPWMTAVVYPQAAPTMSSPAARLVPIAAPGTAASPPLVPISYAPPGSPLPAVVAPAGSLPPLVRIDSVPTPPVVPNRVAALPITPLPVAPPVTAVAPLPTRPVTPPIVTPLPSAAPVAIASPPPVVLPQRLPPQPLPQQVAVPSPQLPTPLQERLPPQATLPPQSLPPQASLPQPPAASPATTPAAAQPAAAPATGKPTDAITIASFNIQVFGESKIAKPHVVDVLARVVRGCDIVAIQEVRAKSDHVIPQFLEAVNADGSRYQFVIGPRLGRTASKEQYVFMYDTTRIEIDPSSVATVPNPGDRLHRPPMVARFRVRTTPPESGFSFWLVDIHTDPDEVPQEVDALADVFVAMRTARPDEDDVILLGDLNAGPPQFGRLGQLPGIGWAVSGVTTNTRRSKTYDNIIFDRAATSEYTGRWGVLDLQNTFGLSLDQALVVSDHNPVWACFRPWETQRTGSLPAAPGQSQ